MSASERVKVVVRCRPLNEKEKLNSYENIVEIDQKQRTINLKNINRTSDIDKIFTFDALYSPSSRQTEIYDESFRPLIDSVLDGFNGTIFAYGQTGTGKTYTMEGIQSVPELWGVIPLSFEHIFQHIARSDSNTKYLVKASYLEIYREEMSDLLAPQQEQVKKRLEIREKPDTGIYIKGLHSVAAKSVEEIREIMQTGNVNRTTGATHMNEHSSRSHAIFIITIECSEVGEDGENHIRVGKLNLVDLAGSERQEKTGATGERFKESTKINLSLCALGNVISAIVDGKSSHVPYRDSKLTRLLQNSLGGNAKTIMVANIGPASYNYEETLMTLRYASRAKNIKNKPRINEDPKDATLRKYQEEIQRLKQKLAEKGGSKSAKKKRTMKDLDRIPEAEDIDKDMNEYSDLCKDQLVSLEVERDTIMNNHNLIKEEKEKLLSQLEEREDLLHQEEQAQIKLGQRIKDIESKLLCGGKNIIDHTNEQEKILEKQRAQIAEEKRKEREIMEKLEATEESKLGTQETYESLQQEVETKTRKLRKLFNKLQNLRSELNELRDFHVKEKHFLDHQHRDLIKEMKFKLMVMENFVPYQKRDEVIKKARYDPESDTWTIDPKSDGTVENKDSILTDSFSGSALNGSIYQKLYQSLLEPKKLLKYSKSSNRILRPTSARGYTKIPLTESVKSKLNDPSLSSPEAERYRKLAKVQRDPLNTILTFERNFSTTSNVIPVIQLTTPASVLFGLCASAYFLASCLLIALLISYGSYLI